jgi:hypothetical protein
MKFTYTVPIRHFSGARAQTQDNALWTPPVSKARSAARSKDSRRFP